MCACWRRHSTTGLPSTFSLVLVDEMLVLSTRHGTGSLGHLVNGSLGHRCDPVPCLLITGACSVNTVKRRLRLSVSVLGDVYVNVDSSSVSSSVSSRVSAGQYTSLTV